jgi:DNA-binding PadR family transcriptional regulator
LAYDIKTICLGALSFGDATGYEIRKQFEEGPFAYFYDASFGSIYPALNKLLADGFVTCTTETQVGRPTKKIYSITDAGLAALRTALAQDPVEHKLRSDFLAALFFGHLVGPEDRAKAYDAYCDFYRNALNSFCERDQLFSRNLVQGFGKHVYQAALDYLESHRDEFVKGDAPASELRRAIGGDER